MKEKEKRWIRFRIYLVSLFFIFGFVVLGLRAYQLQIKERNKLRSIAKSGIIGKVKLPPRRGIIYDREGNELAVSIETGSIYAHPHLVKNTYQVAEELSETLKVSKSYILKLLKKRSSFVWIKRKANPEEVKRIKKLRIEGVGVLPDVARYYPSKEVGAHLIGFVGDDNQGLEGIERKYDRILRGPQRVFIEMLDAKRRPFSIEYPIKDKRGLKNITLTIDREIQYQAQKALRSAVINAGAKSGHCIVMDPNTGEVLAMAVYPEFNPNIFKKYNPSMWRNRAITDCYEPGSTIKAFLLATALDLNVVSPTTRIYCERGAYVVGGHTIHDTKRFENLEVADIIRFSSNIGAVKIGQRLGYDRFYIYLKRFGFGRKTGIALLGESSGFIRPPSKARELDRATVYFGQGMSVTSIQLANAMSAIANGGKLMRPYVVKEITTEDGQTITRTYPQMIRRVIKQSTAEKVREILKGVVSPTGTAPRAAISGYDVAGKTGTSQKVDPKTKRYSDKAYVSIFVGFAPAENPKILVLVMIDEPKGIPYGGYVAGPVFQKIGEFTLNHLGVNPIKRPIKVERVSPFQRNMVYSKNVTFVPEIYDLSRVPDFRGSTMRDVINKASTLGIKVILKGSGIAYDQVPEPGTPIEDVRVVEVRFKQGL